MWLLSRVDVNANLNKGWCWCLHSLCQNVLIISIRMERMALIIRMPSTGGGDNYYGLLWWTTHIQTTANTLTLQYKTKGKAANKPQHCGSSNTIRGTENPELHNDLSRPQWCSSSAKIWDHSSKVGDILQQQIKLDHNIWHQDPKSHWFIHNLDNLLNY